MYVIGALVTTLLISCASTVFAEQSCCGVHLMDSGRRVVIEKEPLPYNRLRFWAVQLRLCTDDPVFLQVWRRLPQTSDPTFVLVWQKHYQATTAQISELRWATINLDDEVDISASGPTRADRDLHLGLFAPKADKMPIPYLFSKDAQTYSSDKWYAEDKIFEENNALDNVTIDMLEWPRYFEDYVVFCRQRYCPDSSRISNDVVGVAGPPGPPGPVGPPGPPGSGGGCVGGVQPPSGGDVIVGEPGGGFPPSVECDIPDMSNVAGMVKDVKTDTDDMKRKMDDLADKLNSLKASDIQPGRCGFGAIQGPSYINSCYHIVRHVRLTMGEAFLHCRDNFTNSRLVEIDDAKEEEFLRTSVRELTGKAQCLEEYWTGGIYSHKVKEWVWIDEHINVKRKVTYNNFPERFTFDDDDMEAGKVCISMNVNCENDNSYWQNDYCSTVKKYFICEAEKQCF
jgi:hypothetical protein